MKTRKLYSKPWDDRCKPLAVQFMFETIWKIYETAENKDADKLKNMIKILDIQIPDKLWGTLQTDPELFSSVCITNVKEIPLFTQSFISN